MHDTHRIEALPRMLFGGENFARSSSTELKRALVVDGIAVLLLLLGLAGAALGQSANQKQDQQKDQKQTQQPASSQAAPADAQQPDSVAEAARKAKGKKAKKVYGEEDLAGLKGGVSVVGDGNATANSAGQDSSATSSDPGAGGGANDSEKQWRQRAQQIHGQMDATDEQIKNLKEDIKKNGASGFDPQKGLRENVIYVDDKNARLKKLEDRKKALEQALDQLQEDGRKAGVPSDWVR
jgi:hypothetical protein